MDLFPFSVALFPNIVLAVVWNFNCLSIDKEEIFVLFPIWPVLLPKLVRQLSSWAKSFPWWNQAAMFLFHSQWRCLHQASEELHHNESTFSIAIACKKISSIEISKICFLVDSKSSLVKSVAWYSTVGKPLPETVTNKYNDTHTCNTTYW